MNDADSTPSPSRFCIRFGMRSAALKASAAGLVPRTEPITTSRIRPAQRDSRMPAATSSEPRELDGGAAGRAVGGAVGGSAPASTGAPATSVSSAAGPQEAASGGTAVSSGGTGVPGGKTDRPGAGAAGGGAVG